jgi:hypothetical protein
VTRGGHLAWPRTAASRRWAWPVLAAVALLPAAAAVGRGEGRCDVLGSNGAGRVERVAMAEAIDAALGYGGLPPLGTRHFARIEAVDAPRPWSERILARPASTVLRVTVWARARDAAPADSVATAFLSHPVRAVLAELGATDAVDGGAETTVADALRAFGFVTVEVFDEAGPASSRPLVVAAGGDRRSRATHDIAARGDGRAR